MSFASLGRRVGNELFKFAFPVYRPLYSAFKSYADRFERELLSRNLFPGAVVVDAGANIGIYSEFLATCVGSGGCVHSFEPDPTNFARLRAALSDSPNVRLNQLAVSDETGESLLYVSDKLNVDHRAYPPPEEIRRTLTIQTKRLDDYFKPAERVDFVKMDIQGYELHALRGARRVLEDNPGIKLLVEFWPFGLRQAGENWQDLISMLESRGMIIREVSTSDLKPLSVSAANERADWYVNLLATPK